MDNDVNETVEPHEAKVNGTLSGPDKWIKFIKDLSAVAILQLMAIGAFYFGATEIRPAIALIRPLTDMMERHERAQSEFYEKHLSLMEENIRLARIQCISYQESLRRSTTLCQGK